MNSQSVLRGITRADAPEVMRVRNSVKENRLSDPSRVPLELYYQYTEDIGRGWLIEEEGVIRAFSIANREPDGRGSIWALFVEPGFEGRGYGQAVMAKAMEWLRAEGLKELWLCTEPGTRAEAFYLAQGWQPGGLKDWGDREFTLSL